MATRSRKKTIKCLYGQLRASQLYDVALTAPTIVEIKHFLKNHPKCAQIWVQDNPQLTHALPSIPLDLPSFLQSQAQAQKQFADDYRRSVQVSVTLSFAAQHLARPPARTSSFPTIFRCLNPDSQRSFCLFVYLDFEMTSRIYTVPELLALKGSQSSQALLDRVKATPELGDIVKQNGGVSSRRLKKVKDEAFSSTDSEDHIVFQGKKQTHLPISNLDGETQWKYRGRAGSERNSNEPIAAPTGLDAQQHEGFQRFFKAVVSPTHVRVTAGGRIVPNTRNTTSPTGKWDKERTAPESDSGDLSKAVPDTVQNGNGQRSTVTTPMMMPPMVHPLYPGFPAMFPPIGAPLPFYPMPNGMPMPYGMPQPHPSMVPVPHSPAAQEEKQSENISEATKTESVQEEDKRSKPSALKISPPEQFDPNRPYFFNGHVFYPSGGPMPMQAQPTPMTPSPYFGGFPVHPAMTRVGSFGQASPMFPMSGPHGMMSPTFVTPLSAGIQNPPMHLAPHASKHDGTPVATGTKAPFTSIKPSQITQSQLASLRSQLKYYEDQLQYNKHQIDEKATQEQTQTIRKLIGQFEHNYQMQKIFENAMSANTEKRMFTVGAEVGHGKTPTTPGMKENIPGIAPQAGVIRSAQRHYPTLNHTVSMDKIRPKVVKELRQRAGINSSKGTDTTLALGALEAHLNKARLRDPVKKSSLPTRAAMAPIFEPRNVSPSIPSHEQSDLSSITDIDASQSSDSQWDYSRGLPPGQQGLWASMTSPVQYVSNGGLATSASVIDGQIVPYLVGQLPRGLTTESAHPSDYTYLRELSEAEKRARHVYWGGVPSTGSGLPKFDGKDFYPASPVKPVDKNQGTPRQTSGGRCEVYKSFDEKAKKSEDPFRASHDSESIRAAKSTRKLSHAVPIINPETMAREDVNITPKAAKSSTPQANTNTEDLRESPYEKVQPSPTKIPTGTLDEKKSSPLTRRGLERSRGSSNDLWQSMMKRGSTSGAVTPGSVSSTTANGLLPQFVSHTTASLSPALTNGNGSLRAMSAGKGDGDVNARQTQAEKTGENRPLSDVPSTQADIIADLHQRMLRDAERRGVIGPGWQ